MRGPLLFLFLTFLVTTPFSPLQSSWPLVQQHFQHGGHRGTHSNRVVTTMHNTTFPIIVQYSCLLIIFFSKLLFPIILVFCCYFFSTFTFERSFDYSCIWYWFVNLYKEQQQRMFHIVPLCSAVLPQHLVTAPKHAPANVWIRRNGSCNTGSKMQHISCRFSGKVISKRHLLITSQYCSFSSLS